MDEGKNLAADLGKAVHFSGMRGIQELGINALLISAREKNIPNPQAPYPSVLQTGSGRC